MKAKIVLFIYALLAVGLVYTRIIDDFDTYKIIKYFLVTSVICYYLMSTKKVSYSFLLILLLYLSSDIVFTISPWHQFFGFSFLLIANTTLSLFILNKANIISVRSIYKTVISMFILLSVNLFYFYSSEIFQTILINAFYISIGLTLLTAYYHHSKSMKSVSLWILLSTLSFVFSNFMSSLNYFIYKNSYFSGLSSFWYVAFLFGITYSVITEAKQQQITV